MSCEPCLDIAATLRRQLVVDIGVQLVFGDGNLMVGHCLGLCVNLRLGASLGLCLSSIENRLPAGCGLTPATGQGQQNHRDPISSLTSTPLMPASFHPSQRDAFALERSFHMGAGAGKPGHYG